MSDLADLLAVHARFYQAFAAGDWPTMQAIWAADDPVMCIHPGGPPLIGRSAVLNSWRKIVNLPPPVEAREVRAWVMGDQGTVLCIEQVADSRMAATNLFRKEAGLWRLMHHQSSPIAGALTLPPSSETPPSRSLH